MDRKDSDMIQIGKGIESAITHQRSNPVPEMGQQHLDP